VFATMGRRTTDPPAQRRPSPKDAPTPPGTERVPWSIHAELFGSVVPSHSSGSAPARAPSLRSALRFLQIGDCAPNAEPRCTERRAASLLARCLHARAIRTCISCPGTSAPRATIASSYSHVLDAHASGSRSRTQGAARVPIATTSSQPTHSESWVRAGPSARPMKTACDRQRASRFEHRRACDQARSRARVATAQRRSRDVVEDCHAR